MAAIAIITSAAIATAMTIRVEEGDGETMIASRRSRSSAETAMLRLQPLGGLRI
jgi:hypothetical protein